MTAVDDQLILIERILFERLSIPPDLRLITFHFLLLSLIRDHQSRFGVSSDFLEGRKTLF